MNMHTPPPDLFRELADAFVELRLERADGIPESGTKEFASVMKEVCPHGAMGGMFQRVLALLNQKNADSLLETYFHPGEMAGPAWGDLTENLYNDGLLTVSGLNSKIPRFHEVFAGKFGKGKDFCLNRETKGRGYFTRNEAAYALESVSLQPHIYMGLDLLLQTLLLYGLAGEASLVHAEEAGRLTAVNAKKLLYRYFNPISYGDARDARLLPPMAIAIFARAQNPKAMIMEPVSADAINGGLLWFLKMGGYRSYKNCPAAGHYTALMTMKFPNGESCAVRFIEKTGQLIARHEVWRGAAERISAALLKPLEVTRPKKLEPYRRTPAGRAVVNTKTQFAQSLLVAAA